MGGAGAGTGAVVAAAAAAVLAKAGLAQLGLFPRDDIIPFSELMRASGAWHTGSSHFLAEGFRMLVCFSNGISGYVSSCHNFPTCSCPTLA